LTSLGVMAENDSNFKWIAIILAAGSSSRMGRPKQFLKIDNESLIRKASKVALSAEADETVIVAGLDHQLIKNELTGLPVQVIANPHSEMGMGSSIKYGVNYIMENHADFNGAIIMVCDQPLLSSAHLSKIISEHKTTLSPIVTSFYSGKNGVPVFFHRGMYEKLLTIKDQQGARNIIEQHSSLVKPIDFPEGAIDLDTPEDYENFLNAEL
jgi:molybdenum cofactor cytidylyltransferase